MKHIMIALALLTSLPAHAESFFQVEAGIGASHVSDMGDGIWIQQGAPNNREQQTTPAFLVGITGQVYQHGGFDVRYHLDYVYIGNYSASVDGVPDAQYNPVTHVVHDMPAGEAYTHFNGFGHAQGIPLTLELGYTYRGFRVAVEGGYWAYEQAWHESMDATQFNRSPKTQFAYVVGARIERGNFGLSYRYYAIRPDWSGNECPGLATGAHVLMATYRF